jgi:hypothetical protein
MASATSEVRPPSTEARPSESGVVRGSAAALAVGALGLLAYLWINPSGRPAFEWELVPWGGLVFLASIWPLDERRGNPYLALDLPIPIGGSDCSRASARGSRSAHSVDQPSRIERSDGDLALRLESRPGRSFRHGGWLGLPGLGRRPNSLAFDSGGIRSCSHVRRVYQLLPGCFGVRDRIRSQLLCRPCDLTHRCAQVLRCFLCGTWPSCSDDGNPLRACRGARPRCVPHSCALGP